jgi:hypothetical protein
MTQGTEVPNNEPNINSNYQIAPTAALFFFLLLLFSRMHLQICNCMFTIRPKMDEIVDTRSSNQNKTLLIL